MIEIIEDQSSEEPLKLEATEDKLSDNNFVLLEKSKLKYTRALLLEFNVVEVCCNLPRDFDLLILRQLDGESDDSTEQNSICGKFSGLGLLRLSGWNFGLTGERWDSHLAIPSSDLQTNCSLEKSNVASEQLHQGSPYDAEVLERKSQQCDFFKLSKSVNPYRPPHCKKKMVRPLGNMSDPGIESRVEFDSDQIVSADIITENDKFGYEIDDSSKKPLVECEDSFKDNEGNEALCADETLTEMIEEIHEDTQLTFDDFWAEILETIHLEQHTSIAHKPDSELDIHLPDEDSLISVDHTSAPENFNYINSGKSDDITDSEGEIIFPDEDILISFDDIEAPDSDSLGPNKVTSKSGINITKNSESQTVTKRDDCSTIVGRHFPGLLTCTKLHSSLSYSQTEKISLLVGNCHRNFPPVLMMPIDSPHIPNFHHRVYQENTSTKAKTSDSFFQYSVLDQPDIFPEQQNNLLVGTSCYNPTKQVGTHDLRMAQFSPLTSPRATYSSIEQSNSGLGSIGEEASSAFSFWHAQY